MNTDSRVACPGQQRLYRDTFFGCLGSTVFIRMPATKIGIDRVPRRSPTCFRLTLEGFEGMTSAVRRCQRLWTSQTVAVGSLWRVTPSLSLHCRATTLFGTVVGSESRQRWLPSCRRYVSQFKLDVFVAPYLS